MAADLRSEQRRCRYCSTSFAPRRRAQQTCSNAGHRWLHRDRVKPRVTRRDVVHVTDDVQIRVEYVGGPARHLGVPKISPAGDVFLPPAPCDPYHDIAAARVRFAASSASAA